jgi:hypothetical protein
MVSQKSKPMDVRLPLTKAPTLKIKTVTLSSSDELSVNLKAKETKETKVNTAEKLRSGFEEAISSLRMGPHTEDISTELDFQINLGECPLALNSFHSILQTLLRLMWESHKRKYGAIAQGFKSALEEKIRNTQKIITQKRQLRESNEGLLKTFQVEAVKKAILKFEDQWAVELEAARNKFQDPTAGIEVLVRKAMDFCGRIKVEPDQVDVGDLLDQTDANLKRRTETLWSLWNLHVKRHKAVFQGNLADLQTIDREIQSLDLSDSYLAELCQDAPESYGQAYTHGQGAKVKTTEETKANEVREDEEQEKKSEKEDKSDKTTPTSETEQAYKAWMEFVKLLGILKIDYDIRITMAKKATTWMSSKITESLHAELSRACMEVLDMEQTSILQSREKMKVILLDVAKSQEVIEAEIKRACNNVVSQYSAALTQMQLTCDLSLEAARETLYSKATALVTRKSSFRI